MIRRTLAAMALAAALLPTAASAQQRPENHDRDTVCVDNRGGYRAKVFIDSRNAHSGFVTVVDRWLQGMGVEPSICVTVPHDLILRVHVDVDTGFGTRRLCVHIFDTVRNAQIKLRGTTLAPTCTLN